MASFYEIISNRTTSDRSHDPLSHCSVCEKTLHDADTFVIAKAYHRGQCVMEAVQCFSCQLDSQEYASEQSMENIMLYSGRRFNQFMQDRDCRENYHLEDPSCLITGEILTPYESFEIYNFNLPGAGLGDENFLFVGPTAMEQMTELLSEQTRKSWGRFIETLSPDAPEIIVSPMFIG